MFAASLRTLLVLGRVSNLPTVWSNCFAAWLLGGGGEGKNLALVLASGSSLYVGGMFLNDACDAEFDRQHRQERPVPKANISRNAVWAWSLALLCTGVLLAVPLGATALNCSIILAAAIIAYDVWHKRYPITLVLMAGCRALLYLFAGTATGNPISPCLLAAAGGLAGYVYGISLLARHESESARPPKWPVLLLVILVVPVGFHLTAKNSAATGIGLAIFIGWLAFAVSQLWRANPQTGRAVGRLLAGIVLTDWLQVAVIMPSWPHAIVWAAFFGFTLWLQRHVPAT